jgi:cytochrome bd-type quinol oxidase subunit 1
MLIALVSVVHVLVAHYAVGGGLFLAAETAHAYRSGNRDYLAYLKRHARFFILLTVVFGAITGVGIWWTIGLASPLATEVLIQTFVFGWAMEWCFFVIEVTAAFVFYYSWGRLPERTHVAVGWVYALAAWISLVLITGITAFMLNPGGWLTNRDFWVGFFNPQFLPQTAARTGGALLLSSLYVYLHAAIMIKDPQLQRLIEQRSTRPALWGAALIAVGGAGWYALLPESAAAVLYSASALNILMALLFAATAVVFAALYLGPYRNPGWLHSPGFAGALLAFGLIAFSTGEFIREAVRKPYVIYNVVLGNQVFPEEVAGLRAKGWLESGVWTRALLAQRHPQAVRGGQIDESALLALPPQQRAALGEMIFQHHCNDCHAARLGYSAAGPLVQGWSKATIRELVTKLDEKRFVMPPWCGADAERELLVEYLDGIKPPRPAGMRPEAPSAQGAP